ncbi:tricarballylate utilization 4Fe-4S protein TcuB [Tropicimonas sp. IMCC34043]|uniref:tricarballylate utilization 4Fe-4S protein TcuB n=1 Tax=Tropicimonas sp. IMCC34043 TaxID=2248760 RepID=UPI000E24B5D5|nr:tricarballylate utilization 4Fe-4S protein TcuB [Tropicimonas sp. IMCC34043]
MSTELIAEARRQTEICNACRYCEGFCSVFPALTRSKVFADGDITHLANLCHNCRGCYYSCQYTEPHEFALNFPAALAEVRQESWERHAWPRPLARLFNESGVAIAAALLAGFVLLFGLLQAFRPESGSGFYAYLAHGTILALFLPAFLLPLASVAVSLRAYWREIGGERLRWRDVLAAGASAARMKNLNGGQGQGCNFEKEDRYSDRRRWFHQAVMYGFLLCFAATVSGTILHYAFAIPAPYGLFSLPKLLGVPGGILLTVGCAGLAWLKTQADPALGAARVWGGEMAFVLLLGATGATGLALYAATGTAAVPSLLAIHLGCIVAFFLLLPFTKMIHGFYRFATLIVEEQKRRA